MAIIQKLKQLFAKQKEEELSRPKDHITLDEWKRQVEDMKNHPLTQAKVINLELMNSIFAVLDQLHEKVDTVNTRLERLEKKPRPRKTGEKKPKVKLSKSERNIVELLKNRKNVQASQIADKLKISRSNASLKLNKLYAVGVVKKTQDGKDVLYNLK